MTTKPYLIETSFGDAEEAQNVLEVRLSVYFTEQPQEANRIQQAVTMELYNMVQAWLSAQKYVLDSDAEARSTTVEGSWWDTSYEESDEMSSLN